MAEPIVKWVGGKSWLARAEAGRIRDKLRHGGWYYEPFVGGGAMALAIGAPINMTLSDTCAPLIDLYVAVREAPAAVFVGVMNLADLGLDANTYYAIRAVPPTNAFDNAVRFLYLNRMCYNGVYRVNSKDEFNVPYGDAAARCDWDPARIFPSLDALGAVSKALRRASITYSDFEPMIVCAGAGDVVYADPPYAETFNSYSADGFGPHDHERLAEALKRAADRGAEVIATNADIPEIRELYSWATITAKAERRAVGQNAASRQPANCLIIRS